MNILDGKKVQNAIIEELKEKISSLSTPPKLAAVIVGDNPASIRYVNHKQKACSRVGIQSEVIQLEPNASQEEILSLIQRLGQDPGVDGILLQLPLPDHLDPHPLIDAIDPQKDVDGLHPDNMGKLLLGREDGFIPCTPKGIQKLLQFYKIDPTGKRVVIVGRSNIVGKPLAALLCQKKPLAGATVTLAHSQTENLKEVCQEADIIIAAMGQAHLIDESFVSPGAVVIDVGISEKNVDGKVCLFGDVNQTKIKKIAAWSSPVPGGVGPMTIASLLENTYLAYTKRHKGSA